MLSLCLAVTWCETNEECIKNPPQIKQPHPLNVMQLFVPHPLFLPWLNLNSMPRNATLMAKLFLYSGYVEAISKQGGISAEDIVKQELERFPYKLKDMFIVRM